MPRGPTLPGAHTLQKRPAAPEPYCLARAGLPEPILFPAYTCARGTEREGDFCLTCFSIAVSMREVLRSSRCGLRGERSTSRAGSQHPSRPCIKPLAAEWASWSCRTAPPASHGGYYTGESPLGRPAPCTPRAVTSTWQAPPDDPLRDSPRTPAEESTHYGPTGFVVWLASPNYSLGEALPLGMTQLIGPCQQSTPVPNRLPLPWATPGPGPAVPP